MPVANGDQEYDSETYSGSLADSAPAPRGLYAMPAMEGEPRTLGEMQAAADKESKRSESWQTRFLPLMSALTANPREPGAAGRAVMQGIIEQRQQRNQERLSQIANRQELVAGLSQVQQAREMAPGPYRDFALKAAFARMGVSKGEAAAITKESDQNWAAFSDAASNALKGNQEFGASDLRAMLQRMPLGQVMQLVSTQQQQAERARVEAGRPEWGRILARPSATPSTSTLGMEAPPPDVGATPTGAEAPPPPQGAQAVPAAQQGEAPPIVPAIQRGPAPTPTPIPAAPAAPPPMVPAAQEPGPAPAQPPVPERAPGVPGGGAEAPRFDVVGRGAAAGYPEMPSSRELAVQGGISAAQAPEQRPPEAEAPASPQQAAIPPQAPPTPPRGMPRRSQSYVEAMQGLESALEDWNNRATILASKGASEPYIKEAQRRANEIVNKLNRLGETDKTKLIGEDGHTYEVLTSKRTGNLIQTLGKTADSIKVVNGTDDQGNPVQRLVNVGKAQPEVVYEQRGVVRMQPHLVDTPEGGRGVVATHPITGAVQGPVQPIPGAVGTQLFSRADAARALTAQGIRPGTPRWDIEFANMTRPPISVPNVGAFPATAILGGGGGAAPGTGAPGPAGAPGAPSATGAPGPAAGTPGPMAQAPGGAMQTPRIAVPTDPSRLTKYVSIDTLQHPPTSMSEPEIQKSGKYVAVPETFVNGLSYMRTVQEQLQSAENVIRSRPDLWPTLAARKDAKDKSLSGKDMLAVSQARAKYAALTSPISPAKGTDPDVAQFQSNLVAMPGLVKTMGDAGNVAIVEQQVAAASSGMNGGASREAALAAINNVRNLINGRLAQAGVNVRLKSEQTGTPNRATGGIKGLDTLPSGR
jgi:hypothetical protein